MSMTNHFELFNDRILRYETMARVRRSQKQKDKFINIILQEIISIREDVLVCEFQDKTKKVGKNIYVGNIDTASKIISTYYDTPAKFIGNYYFDDNKKNGKNTINEILIESALYLFVGVFVFLGIQWFFNDKSSQIYWVVVAIFTFIYFMIFKNITNGRSEKKNLVRNTSTIVQLLDLMQEINKKDVAFALVDFGCNSELGLHALKAKNEKAQIIYLDSINTENDLYINSGNQWDKLSDDISFNKKAIYRIVSGKIDENKKVYLNKDSLNKQEINESNFEKIKKLIELQEGIS
jgi:hypothetical protein